MTPEDANLRSGLRHELAAVDAKLPDLIAFVSEEVAAATEALLHQGPRCAVEVEP